MPRNKAFDQQEILNKAKNLFWSKGYHATSIQDLVDQMQINRSSIYHTYGDKYELFKMCLSQYREETYSELREKLIQEKPVKEILHELFYTIGSDCICEDSKGCFLVNSALETPSDPFVSEITSKNRVSIQNDFQTLIEKGKKSGEITSDLPSGAIAAHLFNSYVGLRVLGASGMHQKELQNIISVALSVLE